MQTAEIIIDFLELILFFTGVYYVMAGVFSFFGKSDIALSEVNRKFAVIVSAHNEGAVIGRLLLSIENQTYPRSGFDVFVVADGCSDNTAAVAASYGAEVIYIPGRGSGKAETIRRAAEHILALGSYDAAAFFDADNIVDPDCLAELNYMFDAGYSVVQARLTAKNPDVNWLTAAYSLWHKLENRFGRQGSHNIGIGCKLSGTGFAVMTEVLAACPWNCKSIAEDLEYTMELGLKGIRPAYANRAVVFDEKPSGFSASVMQRLRWAQGVVDVQGKYGVTLLCKGKITLWLSLYGDFLGVFTYSALLLINVFATVSFIFGTDFVLCRFWVLPAAYTALNLYLAVGALCAFAGLIVDKELNRHIMTSLFGFIIYILSWIPIGIMGVLRHNKREWYHTEHNG